MSAGVQEVAVDTLGALSRAHAGEIHRTSGRRSSAPIRSVFARDAGGQGASPMAKLVGMRGRGGEVPLKLLTALIWRSAAPPFNTSISARKWAELLALPDPAHLGARRVTDALKTLEEHRLVTLEKRRGESSVVTLLDESGSGEAYVLPRGSGDRYFHLPAGLWLTGKMQRLSAPAIGMLMAVLVDQDPKSPGTPVWWSTRIFPQKFGISPSSRSRGTRELIDAGLLTTKRIPIPTTANRDSFSEERVRNLYSLTGEALMAIVTKPRSTDRQ